MLPQSGTQSEQIGVEELIARRSDLSTFIVHLTRDYDSQTAFDNLTSIINSWTITAKNEYGAAVARLDEYEREESGLIVPADRESQRVVCFTETPLQYLYLMTMEMDGRDVQFAPYGIAVTKSAARENGANPVWYLDITSGPGINDEWLTTPVNKLIDSAIHSCEEFSSSEIAKIAPFIEEMGTGTRRGDGQRYRKEFWWEREWRCRGDFKLPDRVLIICPETDTPHFEQIVEETLGVSAAFIDPDWGLEQIIARLAGFTY